MFHGAKKRTKKLKYLHSMSEITDTEEESSLFRPKFQPKGIEKRLDMELRRTVGG